MPNHKRSNASRPVIIVIFDDLYTGGAFTIVNQLLTHVRGYRFVVVVGVADHQTVDKNLFRYAERVVTYRIPESSSARRFFHITQSTWAILSRLGKQYPTAGIIGNVAVSACVGKLYAVAYSRPYISLYHGALYLERASAYRDSPGVIRRIKHVLGNFWSWGMQYIAITGSTVGCFSEYSASQIRSAFHSPDPWILRVPIGTTPVSAAQKRAARNSLGIANKTRLVLIPSRIEPRKGQHLALEALSHLPKSLSVTLVCIGSVSPMSYDYLECLYKTKVSPHHSVYFAGEKRYEELSRWYMASDLTLMSSIDLETFGMVTLESMSFGVPVVGFGVAGTTERLKPFPELCVTRISSKSLAQTIARYFALPSQKRRQLSQRIADFVAKNHDTKAANAAFEQLINHAIKRTMS